MFPEILWGWAVILIALIAVIGPIMWLGNKNEPVVPRPFYDWDTAEITTAPTYVDGVVIFDEPMIIDTRGTEDPDVVSDVLGDWKPWEHTPAEPVLLGHVMTSQRWDTFGTEELRVLAA